MEVVFNLAIVWLLFGACISLGFLFGWAMSVKSGFETTREDAVKLLRWCCYAMMWPIVLVFLLITGVTSLVRALRSE